MPVIWHTLKDAQRRKMVVIDEENDAIAATNRLLLTNGIMQENLRIIADDKPPDQSEIKAHFKQLVASNASPEHSNDSEGD